MKEDFSTPKEFEDHSKALFKKDQITEREFVDFCSLAIKLIDTNWDKRWGMAYSIAGAWLKYDDVVCKDDLLDQIGAEFGQLELPDKHSGGTEEGVRQRWQQVKMLIEEADKKFKAK